MQSRAATVEEYLAELPEDRRQAVEEVRRVILDNLDREFEEGMQYGMIGYYVPHRVYPPGYHCDPRQPLPFAGLASQKNAISFYLMTLYADDSELRRFQDAWTEAGKKLDMGKSCVRFRTLDGACLDAIGSAIKRVSAARFIAIYESRIRRTGAQNTGRAPKRSKAAASRKAKPAPPAEAKPAKRTR